MKITSIKQQAKRADRYSIFVDEKYAFSLSEAALLESQLVSGQELSPQQLKEFKKLSADDKLYHQAWRYIALRPRSRYEMETYLRRKQADPPLVEQIISKFTAIELLHDAKFAQAFINNRRLLKPTSRRKLQAELRKKGIEDSLIQEALGHEASDEQAALREVIERKRRQTKYQDSEKLLAYLARQGFSYDDIKHALAATED